jgi:hypothetical protein
LGPQFLFKVCAHREESFPHCHWSAQAEIGIGLLIAALGACGMMSMQCRKVAFPALTIESVVLLVFSAVIITVTAIKK